MKHKCPKCMGYGDIGIQACPDCRGTGLRPNTEILHVVGYLRVDKDGTVVRHDGGTIVVTPNDIGWGDRAPQIAAQIVELWNQKLQQELAR